MSRLVGMLLLVFGWNWHVSYAQQLAWERPLDFPPSNVSAFGYQCQLDNGDFLVSGIKSINSFPFIYSRVAANGTVAYQRTGRTLFTLEQGVVPLAGRNGSSLLAASVPGRRVSSNNGTSRLFFQRIRPNGDTLPGLTYPVSFVEGYPTRAVREGDSVRVLTYAIDNQSIGQYALLSTDTLGTVGQVRRYASPTFGNAYPCDLLRTARGGWLIVGALAGLPYTHTYLLETDAQGRLRRQREPLLFTGKVAPRSK